LTLANGKSAARQPPPENTQTINVGGTQTQLLIITIVNTGGTANNPPHVTSARFAPRIPRSWATR
jgi:hypothetical protein